MHWDSYEKKDKTKIEFIALDVINPLGDEDLGDIRIACKWKNDKGIFDFKAKKKLRATDVFTVSGYLMPTSFFSKRAKRKLTIVGVFLSNPFFDGELECTVRDAEQYAVLALLLSERWGIKLSRYADEPEGNIDGFDAADAEA